MKAPAITTSRPWIRRSPEQWRDLFHRFEQSGQTREQFCAEHGLAVSSFSRWRQKLRRDVPTGAMAAEAALFVELTPDPQSCVTPVWDVELELGGGVWLRLRRPC